MLADASGIDSAFRLDQHKISYADRRQAPLSWTAFASNLIPQHALSAIQHLSM